MVSLATNATALESFKRPGSARFPFHQRISRRENGPIFRANVRKYPRIHTARRSSSKSELVEVPGLAMVVRWVPLAFRQCGAGELTQRNVPTGDIQFGNLVESIDSGRIDNVALQTDRLQVRPPW